MNSTKNLFFIVLMTSVSQLLHGSSDDVVVNSIKSYSNLTQADVDRWTFLWAGTLAEPAVGAAALYGVYKGGKVGYETASQHNDLIKNVFKNEWMPQFLRQYEPSENVQGWMTGKWVWAGVGVTAVGLAAYKVLYPRIQTGIIEKIKNYIELCNRLAVTNKQYSSEAYFKHALHTQGNLVWASSNPIAVKNGLDNLWQQSDIALGLIDLLQESGSDFVFQANGIDYNAQKAVSRIAQFKFNLSKNYTFIDADVKDELRKRREGRAAYGEELKLQGQEAGIAAKRIKTLKNQWELLKDISKAAKYIATEYGPGIAAGVGLWEGYRRVKARFTPPIE